jgi:hypothetical protein
MLEASLGLPLTNADVGAKNTRLGVAAPTSDQLADVLSRIEHLLAKFSISNKAVLVKADEIKAEEAAETARLAAILDPIAVVGPQHVERLPSIDPVRHNSPGSPQRAKSLSVAEEKRRNAASVAMEAREYNLVNTEREIELQLADARASTENRIAAVHAQAAALQQEIECIQGQADHVHEVVAAENRAIDQRVSAIDDAAHKHREAAAEIRAQSERLSSEMRSAKSLSAARDDALRALSQEHTVSRMSVEERTIQMKRVNSELTSAQTELRLAKKTHTNLANEQRSTSYDLNPNNFNTPRFMSAANHLGPVDSNAIPYFPHNDQNQQHSALYSKNSSSGCNEPSRAHSNYVDPTRRLAVSNCNSTSSGAPSVSAQPHRQPTNTFTTSHANNNNGATVMAPRHRTNNNSSVDGTDDYSPAPDIPKHGGGRH